MSGVVLGIKISPNDPRLVSYPVTDLKTSGTAKTVNYLMQYQGLAQSVLLDNQDAANAETVRINNNFNTITIPASAFRTLDAQWIEQIALSGASTNLQMTAQLVPRAQLGI